MSNEVSWIPVIPAAQKAVGDRVIWCMGLDSTPDVEASRSFTIALNSSEDWPPTHYALSGWCDIEKAEERLAMPLNGGTLPPLTRTLEAGGVTEAEALAFCASIDPWCRTGGTAMENFSAMCTARGLVRVFDPEA